MGLNEESILADALERKTPDERAAFLDKVCAGQPDVRKEVESLINAYSEGEFLEASSAAPNVSGMIPFTSDESGAQIGPYKLLEKIGEGGMGVVYMAEQNEPIKRRVALKIIKLGMDTKQVVGRFEVERRALALMDHPNIAKVLDAGATETGRPYFVMELVRGIPITAFCDENELDTQERLELFIPVCQAIQQAHQKAIIHRDVKPSNVLVTMHDNKPVPKVIDFGIAKATRSELTTKTVFTGFHQFIGTPAYMSPEQTQMNGIDIDTRTDVYALGVLLYELITGTTPFDEEKLLSGGFDEICRRLREDEPPKPSSRYSTMDVSSRTSLAKSRRTDPHKLGKLLRGDLDWIVIKAMEKDRIRRYETTIALAQDVKHFLTNEPVSAVAPSSLYRVRKFTRRHKTGVAAALAIATALVLGTVVASWQAYVAISQRDRAENEAERASRLHYYSSMQAIGHGWQSNDLTRVPQLLEETRPFPWRGFEWSYWQRQMHGATRTFRGHKDNLRDVVFSPDGRSIATGGDDGTARIWDLMTGETRCVFPHGKFVQTVAFSPDGNCLVTAGGIHGGKRQWLGAVIWDVTNGNVVAKIEPHDGGPDSHVASACFSTDGTRIVCGENHGVVRVCDATTGQELFQMEQRHEEANVWAVAHSNDGKIGSAGGNAATIWDAKSGKLLHKLPHDDGVTCLAFSPDGKRVATGSWEIVAQVWDTSSGQKTEVELVGHTAPIWGIDYSPDGQRIVTGSFDQTVRVWDATSARQLHLFLGHTDGIWGARFSPDGRSVATAGWDDHAKLWDVGFNQGPQTVRLGSEIKRVSLLPNGDLVAFGKTGESTVLQTAIGPMRFFPNERVDDMTVMVVSPDGEWIVTARSDATVQIWDAISGERLDDLEGVAPGISAIAVSSDRKSIVTGSSDGSIRIWDMTKREASRISAEDGVHDIAISPDGRWFVVACGRKSLSMRDIKTGEQLRALDWNGFSDTVAISDTGDRVAAGGWDHRAAVWDSASGQRLVELQGHDAFISSISFAEGGQRILTASPDATAKLWETSTGRELLSLKVPRSSLDRSRPEWLTFARMSADGTRITTIAGSTTIRVWRAAALDQIAAWRKEQETAKQD